MGAVNSVSPGPGPAFETTLALAVPGVRRLPSTKAGRTQPVERLQRCHCLIFAAETGRVYELSSVGRGRYSWKRFTNGTFRCLIKNSGDLLQSAGFIDAPNLNKIYSLAYSNDTRGTARGNDSSGRPILFNDFLDIEA